MNTGRPHLRTARRRQRGAGLIELMVGATVGLFVAAGASLMAIRQLGEHRRLTLETQVQQDLRSAADLMLRELRRAGSRQVPERGVWAPDAAAVIANPYATVAPADDETGPLLYSYSRHDDRRGAPRDPEDDRLNPAVETFGFRVERGVLQFRLGTRWQPLTDPQTLIVDELHVALVRRSLELAEFCPQPCPIDADCPRQQLRRFTLGLTGHARSDPKVVRSLHVEARVRNDLIDGACPT